MNYDHSKARRRALVALLGAGAGLPGALQLALAQSSGTQGLRRVRGEVTINGRPAAEGDPVHAGDAVVTGKRSLAVFVVGGDAFLMRDNSRAELSGKEVALDALRLITGKLLGVFQSGRNRRIATPTATIGIRGTGCYTEAQDARTYFCLCYGTADVASENGDAKTGYSTTHHESPRYIYNDGRKDAIVPASALNHTDSELIMLEALVGRKPPAQFFDDPFKPY
jgi:hypothetical protein